MSFFKGKRKKGLNLADTKKSSYKYKKDLKQASSTPSTTIKTANFEASKNAISADSTLFTQNVSTLLDDSQDVFTGHCYTEILTKCLFDTLSYNDQNNDTFNYHDAAKISDDTDQNVSMEDSPGNESLISKLLQLLPSVIHELGEYMNFLLDLFQVISNKTLSTDNLAFVLFRDVVRWFNNTDGRLMRYSPISLQFFWLGRTLFGGRFVRFMTGLKNETCNLLGTSPAPCDSKINFAVPSENILREIHPLGPDFQTSYKPGLIMPMIKLKAEKAKPGTSYVLMFDGKKVRHGGDEDLLGFEEGPSLEKREQERDNFVFELEKATILFQKVLSVCTEVTNTPVIDREGVFQQLKKLFHIFSMNMKVLRERKKKKDFQLTKLRDKQRKEPGNTNITYSMDFCRTFLHKLDNALSTLEDVQWIVCKAGAHLNNKASIFASGKVVDLSKQNNVRLLSCPDDLREKLNIDTLDTSITKQRSTEWFEDRKKVKVTGSSIYQAIGCDGLKSQKEHFDKVVSGINPKPPLPETELAMRHGTECEIHQIATLSAVVLPFLYPDLHYQEEGYYKNTHILVSPDGSLRNNKNIKFAFEGKAPFNTKFTYPVHYSVPQRYIPQTMYEQRVLSATEGTLYMCWSKNTSTLFRVPPNEHVLQSIDYEIEDMYHSTTVRRPTRLSDGAKILKETFKTASSCCEFIGEFPSVTGIVNANDGQDFAEVIPQSCTYDDLLKAVHRAKQAILTTYDLQRRNASQVVVYLLADLDRMWKPEEPHAVPVLYYYRGYSLSMANAREITEYCKTACREHGLDIVACSADGEFIPLMVSSKDGLPLTLLQLSKKIWSEVCRIPKGRILKILQTVNREYRFHKEEHKIVLTLPDGDSCLHTPTKGWGANNKSSMSTTVQGEDRDELYEEEQEFSTMTDNYVDIVQNDAVVEHLFETSETSTSQTPKDQILIESAEQVINSLTNTRADTTEELNSNLDLHHNEKFIESHGEFSNQNRDSNSSDEAHVSVLDEFCLSEILEVLESLKSKKTRISTNTVKLKSMMSTSVALNKFLKNEIIAITSYLNRKLPKDGKQLTITGLTKTKLINQLSEYLGHEQDIQVKKRKLPIRNPKSLKDLASRTIRTKTYPKQVLNIAYSEYLWPRSVKLWRKKARIADKVEIKTEDEVYLLEPYYVPEFNDSCNEFELFTYDKTHLGTNLRKALCLNRIVGIDIKAWEAVADESPQILNKAIIEVSDGKILDQMKETLARTVFSKPVQQELQNIGWKNEASFCEIVREALYVADDDPGIPAKDRCVKRLNFIQWLNTDTNFGKFPPYGARIKGLSYILYEGLRTSLEAKLYLYAIAKKGTYSARAPNTLCSESFFSSMQEMDRWGQGILTTRGVEKHISDFTTITAMKMNENKSVYIRTKKDRAYPNPETSVDANSNDDEEGLGENSLLKCTCRSRKFIQCIVPRDHFFDTKARGRSIKKEKCYQPNPLSKPARGEQPIRQQFGYKINEMKLLSSQREGIKLCD